MQLAGQWMILVLCAQTAEYMSLLKHADYNLSTLQESRAPKAWVKTTVIRKLATDPLGSVGLLCSAKKGRQCPFAAMGLVYCLSCASYLWDKDLF